MRHAWHTEILRMTVRQRPTLFHVEITYNQAVLDRGPPGHVWPGGLGDLPGLGLKVLSAESFRSTGGRWQGPPAPKARGLMKLLHPTRVTDPWVMFLCVCVRIGVRM